MTNEEALEKIDDTLGVGRISVEAENIAFWETVRSAVEKQIPKKPIENEYGYFYCATCKGDEDCLMYDNSYEDRYNYCHNCGQRLDWSREV